jgi:hypothetical protein
MKSKGRHIENRRHMAMVLLLILVLLLPSCGNRARDEVGPEDHVGIPGDPVSVM